MSVSYFVRYEISPRDPQAFLDHYRTVHVPILARWPGMRRVVLHTNLPARDPMSTQPGGAFLLAQLEFESQADLEAAFASPERVEARRDFHAFPPFEGTVTHQAMLSEEAWRRDL